MDTLQINLRKKVYALFYIGLLGQIAFAFYIAVYLLWNAIKGNFQSWNEHMANGIIEGDQTGNFMLVLHVALALSITIGGPLQFIPALRKRYKTFHKWNGRFYIFSVIITAIVASFLVWSRPLVIGGYIGLAGNTLNAILIVLFGSLTIYTAMKKQFEAHRKWAIRTFLVVSGVWFFRIMFGTWLLVTGFKAPGINEDLTGWFSNVLYFGSYLIPLAIAEIYLYLKTSSNVRLIKYYSWTIVFLCPLLFASILLSAKIFWLK